MDVTILFLTTDDTDKTDFYGFLSVLIRDSTKGRKTEFFRTGYSGNWVLFG